MKLIYILILTIVLHNANGQDASKTKSLESELKRLKTETALIVQAEGIANYPLWSPQSDYVACNVNEKWYKLRLTNIDLTKTKWRGDQIIGVLTTEDAHTLMTESEVKMFSEVSKLNPREVTTKDGTKIELKETGDFGVSLIITRKGAAPKTLWSTASENCHSLVLSPDEKYVAFISELNGLIVMKLK